MRLWSQLNAQGGPWPGFVAQEPSTRCLNLGQQDAFLCLAEATRCELGWYRWPCSQGEKSVCDGGDEATVPREAQTGRRRGRAIVRPWTRCPWGGEEPLSFTRLSCSTYSVISSSSKLPLVCELVQTGFLSFIITNPNWYKEEPSYQKCFPRIVSAWKTILVSVSNGSPLTSSNKRWLSLACPTYTDLLPVTPQGLPASHPPWVLLRPASVHPAAGAGCQPRAPLPSRPTHPNAAQILPICFPYSAYHCALCLVNTCWIKKALNSWRRQDNLSH